MRTKYTSSSFIIFLILLHIECRAQQSWFKFDSTIAVSNNTSKLLNPWVGGLNAAQYLKMDLDNDGIEDLIIYDRTNSKITTFLARTDPSNSVKKAFVYAPSYELLFPKMDNWMILADYNGDGLKDLFASTPLGITVYRQVKSGSSFTWQLAKDALNTKGFSGDINLQVSGTDIPQIVDIDDDGDLDVLTFDFTGTYIELHQNLSMDKYGVPDSLGQPKNPVFVRNGDCWGNFHKGNGEDFVLGDDCGVVTNPGGRVMHAGNSILLHDLNGDGTRDLLAGHISNEHISFLRNSAKGLIANFTSYTNSYPTIDPVSFYIFPSAFMEDVDFDGVEDLLITPNLSGNDANLVDFKSSNWFYHNAGTTNNPDFKLLQKNFLQDQMIDVGENAAPSFFDVDGDGDLDMIVGNAGIQASNGFRGSLWLLRNTGSASQPAYQLESENYLGISSASGLYNIKPQWADFNGDGIPDLGLSGTTTDDLKPKFIYIPNKGTAGGAAQLTATDAVTLQMPVESLIGDSPFFYDTDGDGDLDLLVGKPQGNIYYYLNTGNNKTFTFQLNTDSFAGVSVNFEGRFSQPVVADFDLDGRPDLLTVDQTGTVRLFHSAAWGQWTSRETALIEVNGKKSAPSMGNYLTAAIADYNGDGKPDIAVGTNAGGVRLLLNILPITITGTDPKPVDGIKVYPNPSDDYIKILSARRAILRVFNVSGAMVLADKSIAANQESQIETTSWSPGLYLLEFQSGDAKVVKKLVIR